jgi:hypothetical protein
MLHLLQQMKREGLGESESWCVNLGAAVKRGGYAYSWLISAVQST